MGWVAMRVLKLCKFLSLHSSRKFVNRKLIKTLLVIPLQKFIFSVRISHMCSKFKKRVVINNCNFFSFNSFCVTTLKKIFVIFSDKKFLCKLKRRSDTSWVTEFCCCYLRYIWRKCGVWLGVCRTNWTDLGQDADEGVKIIEIWILM